MKLRLLILLAAAALAAAPAAGQTVKSLGYNTTNGQIVYSGSNSLTFTNALQFSTNARAATRTNLGLGATWLTNTSATNFRTDIGLGTTNAVGFRSVEVSDGINAGIMRFTNITSGIQFLVGGTPKVSFTATNSEFATNVTVAGSIAFSGSAATTLTNLGLGANNTVTFSNIQLGILGAGSASGFVGRNSGGSFELDGTNVSTSVPAFYGWSGFASTAFSAGTARTNLELGATNAVTFSNITATGTLTATGNATLNGVGNTAPSQTASSGSSLMTRDLGDDRYRIFYVPLVHAQTSTAANGSTWNLRPFHSADAVFSAPPWARNVRVYLSTAFTNAPITNNFTAVITAYQITTNSVGISYGNITNAFSVTPVFNNGSNFHRFILRMTNDMVLSTAGISDAESAGFWNILIQLQNNSSASLTTVPDNWLRGMAVFTD
jgi:hypothetical protein